MPLSKANFLEGLKKMKGENIVFLVVLFFYFLILLSVFNITIRFFSQNINKIFTPIAIPTLGALDMPSYVVVAKKLNFKVSDSSETKQTSLEATSSNSDSTTPLSLDKKSLTIEILNSTKTGGLASKLSDSIESEGFIVIKTGNEPKQYDITTLIIQKEKEKYVNTLLAAIRKSYPDAVATTTENGTYEAVIVIGGQ